MDLRNNRLALSFKEEADPRTLSWFEKIYNKFNDLIATIRGIKVDLPTVYPVIGKVAVSNIENLPPVEIKNLAELGAYFEVLKTSLGSQQAQVISAIEAFQKVAKITQPQAFKFDKPLKIEGWDDLLSDQEEIKKGFNFLLKKEGVSNGPMEVMVKNWQPQIKPQPVTNVNINPLRGYIETTSVTVGTTPTPLPGTSLAQRRSLICYNNSANTIYIGGSDVTSSNGFPLLTKQYSPPIDAGPRMLIYGVATTSSNDIRVMEASNDASGGSY